MFQLLLKYLLLYLQSIYQPRIIADVDDTPFVAVIDEDTSAKHTDEVDNTYKINKRVTLPWK
jgi:hypothetical protein